MTIRHETAAGIATLTFDRPQRRHAITADMYAQLAAALESAAADPAVRVARIRGSEDAFTAGNDLGDFLANPPAGDDAPVMRFLRAIAAFPKPLIASVCGPAVGVGTTMLLHCDLVYAGESASFSLPFANLGLCPEAGASLLLPALAGWQRAAEKLLFGEPFGAAEAHAMGLVNRVLPSAEVDGFAARRAAELASRPLPSLLATKALMRAPRAQATAEQMRLEGARFVQMLREPAAREAFAAFMEKRAPDFGRVGA